MKWGLLIRPGNVWVGVHYSPYNRRWCINLVPFLTQWISTLNAPEGGFDIYRSDRAEREEAKRHREQLMQKLDKQRYMLDSLDYENLPSPETLNRLHGFVDRAIEQDWPLEQFRVQFDQYMKEVT